MTAAEIEKLKALERATPVSGCVYYRDNEKPVADLAAAAVKALPRLLEERERLLEALLRIKANEGVCDQESDIDSIAACGERYPRNPECWCSWCVACAEIAFAEAPAGKEKP